MENSESIQSEPDGGPGRPSRREDKPPQPLPDDGEDRLRSILEHMSRLLSPRKHMQPSRINSPRSNCNSLSRYDSVSSVRSDVSITSKSSFEFLPPHLSELRVVLLGNSWSQRSSVGNFMLGATAFNTEKEASCCLSVTVLLEDKKIILINTPDLLHPNVSEKKLMEHVKKCVSLSDPGPHVFLLVLQPEGFTEEHKLKLCRVLQCFSDKSFDHSLVLMSPREQSPGFMEEHHQRPPFKDLIRRCQNRFLWQKNLELPELLTHLGQIVRENNGEHLSPRGSI